MSIEDMTLKYNTYAIFSLQIKTSIRCFYRYIQIMFRPHRQVGQHSIYADAAAVAVE